MPATMKHYYGDSDSPFDETLRRFEDEGADALDVVSDALLEELEGCALMKLDCPCYEGEPRLTAFLEALREAKQQRFAYLRCEICGEPIDYCQGHGQEELLASELELHHTVIRELCGERAAEQANYGWGVTDREIATKVYGHGVLVSDLVDETLRFELGDEGGILFVDRDEYAEEQS